MKLGIMQPYFFPYIGYYSLIYYSDYFILLDDVQIIRHGWIERNRTLKPGAGWQYIAVPLQKRSLKTAIRDVKIRNDEDWKTRIVRQLEHYRKKAPNYSQTMAVIEASLEIETESIVKMNQNILRNTCEYIGIEPNINIFSDLELDISEVTGPGDWALNISKSLNASEYINPVGGKEIFDNARFASENIKLKFLKNNLVEYSQRRTVFERGLSIVDIMMFNNRDVILGLIKDVDWEIPE